MISWNDLVDRILSDELYEWLDKNPDSKLIKINNWVEERLDFQHRIDSIRGEYVDKMFRVWTIKHGEYAGVQRWIIFRTVKRSVDD